jgi:hypothetical protein
MDVAVTSESAEKRGSLARAISSILNKHANGVSSAFVCGQISNGPPDCTRFVDVTLNKFWTTHVIGEEVAARQRVGALELWASVSIH